VDPKARRRFYVVYNELDVLPAGSRETRSLVVKLTYLLRLRPGPTGSSCGHAASRES